MRQTERRTKTLLLGAVLARVLFEVYCLSMAEGRNAKSPLVLLRTNLRSRENKIVSHVEIWIVLGIQRRSDFPHCVSECVGQNCITWRPIREESHTQGQARVKQQGTQHSLAMIEVCYCSFEGLQVVRWRQDDKVFPWSDNSFNHWTAQSRPDRNLNRERFFIRQVIPLKHRPSRLSLCYVGGLTNVESLDPEPLGHLPRITRQEMVLKNPAPHK